VAAAASLSDAFNSTNAEVLELNAFAVSNKRKSGMDSSGFSNCNAQ